MKTLQLFVKLKNDGMDTGHTTKRVACNVLFKNTDWGQ